MTSSKTRRSRGNTAKKNKNQNPPDQREDKSVLLHQQVTRSGPLPAPDDFSRYEQIHPGAAKMILDMANQESEHRRTMEAKAMLRSHREAVLGQIFGLLIGLGGLMATVMLGYFDQGTAASFIGGGTLLGLVTVFIKGRSK